MPVVLIPVAWLAVLILMIAVCRVAAAADGTASAPAGEPAIFVRLGRDALPGPDAEPRPDHVASMDSRPAPRSDRATGGPHCSSLPAQ